MGTDFVAEFREMGSFSLKCFGVGDGWPCADRNHSSFLYQFGKNPILIDCGEPLSSSYKASGYSYDLLDAIFLSHLHADHLGGFFMFMQGLWLERRCRPLTVHLPTDGVKPVPQLLRAGLIFPDLLPFKLQFKALCARRTEVIGKVRVTPFRSTHLEQLRRAFQRRYPQKYQAYCFLMETENLRIGHSADIGRPEDLEPMFKAPLDLLVCELAHFNPEVLFRYLKDKPVKRIIFIHLARTHWENLKRTGRLAARTLGGIPFKFARDGEEFKL